MITNATHLSLMRWIKSLLLISMVLYATQCLANEFRFFNSYLNDQFVSKQLKQAFPFEFVSNTVDNKRSYAYSLKFKKSYEDQYYIFGVYISKAGGLLDLEEYENDYKKFAAQNPSAKKTEIEFPNIGKRARRNTGFFGPGGSSHGVVFTTSDGLYDVKLVESLLLPEKVKSPKIDVRAAAHLISNAYDKQLNSN